MRYKEGSPTVRKTRMFAIVLAVYKARLWLLFAGSIFHLALLAVLVYAVLRWGTRLALGRRVR